MIQQNLRSEGTTFKTSAIACVADGFLFETIHTDDGVLWFKTKIDC